ncbi:MAG: hypothetical protein BMS9Abin26_0190 [Gammaproteobacteria bacterium]|nr:MAG: hypothetical protein BMS9Abin26_0190 [Gammaproteobacteria bacterium]
MKTSNFLIFLAFFAMAQANADSVKEWGHWAAEDDPAKAILAGADPADVTAPSAAGPGRPFSPVNFPVTTVTPLNTPQTGGATGGGFQDLGSGGNTGVNTRRRRGGTNGPTD